MDDQHVQFLPFHAINEFMTTSFRQQVVRDVLQALPGLPGELRAAVERSTRKSVQVPGFRNSAKAPLAVRIKPVGDAFEKSPELVASVLAAWAEAKPELRQKVHDLLAARGWELLPVEADRTRLPGFLIVWPKGENFEGLNEAYVQAHPEDGYSSDDVSLMVVWVSGRLPYTEEETEEELEED